jgi:hypothetical protein
LTFSLQDCLEFGNFVITLIVISLSFHGRLQLSILLSMHVYQSLFVASLFLYFIPITKSSWFCTYTKLQCNSVKIRFSQKNILNYACVLKNGVGLYNIFLFYFYTKLAEPSFVSVFA